MEDPCSLIFIHFTADIITDPRLDFTETWVTVDMVTTEDTGLMTDMEIAMGYHLDITVIPAMATVTTTEDITHMVTISTDIEPDTVKNNNLTGTRQVVVFNDN